MTRMADLGAFGVPRLADSFDPWPLEALEAIHNASLVLLERIGVHVDSPLVHDILENAGCRPASCDRVLLPKDLVMASLDSVPQQYARAARDPEKSLSIDHHPGPIYVHNGGGAPNVTDGRDGHCRRAVLADQRRMARVLHHFEHVHEVITSFEVEDVPAEVEPLYSFLAVALETDKCASGSACSGLLAEATVEMAMALTGTDGSDGRYPVDLAFSPVSPLRLGRDVSEALVTAVRTRRVVCEVLPAPTAGTTAPASLSAALAQQNAEVLAGLVLAQAAAPGTPMVYGPRLAGMDPRTGGYVSGSPQMCLCSIAATLLARRYGLACDCYGLTTGSKVADAQLGWEHAVNAFLGMHARPRFLSGVGDVGTGHAASLEVAVLDEEVLGNLFFVFERRRWDQEALDVEAMVEGVLGGGGFLGTKHTRRFIREDHIRSRLSFHGGDEEWLALGRASVLDAARDRVAELLAHPPVEMPDDLFEELCRIIDKTAAKLGLEQWPDPRRLREIEVGP